MMMRGEAGLLADLHSLFIPFTAHEHEAVFTVAQSERVNADLVGEHSKNLFLKDQAGAFWLVTVPANRRVDLKALPAAIGSKRVSFGKAADMQALIGVEPGSVTPLAAINAPVGRIHIVLDQSLAVADVVNVHPLRNTGTLALSGPSILQLLRHWGHDPQIIAIPAAA